MTVPVIRLLQVGVDLCDLEFVFLNKNISG